MPSTDGENQVPAAAPTGSPAPGQSVADLRVRADGHKDDAIWKLEVMSRRGRLPGFRRTVGGFAVAAHGNPFDKILHLKAESEDGGVSFVPELSLDRRMPTVTLLIFIVTVWPGVMLTDSFLYGHFQFYMDWINNGLETWWWYVPLTVVSLVWAWLSAMKKSDSTAGQSAREAMEKIAAELDGSLTPAGQSSETAEAVPAA